MQADTPGLVYRTRETSAAAFADRSLVGLVMHNFISNALRYTSPRRRADRLPPARQTAGTGGVGHGPGIPRPVGKHLQRVPPARQPERDRRKGLGLGLAIVQRLAREMRTSVELRSPGPAKARCSGCGWTAGRALEDEAQPPHPGPAAA